MIFLEHVWFLCYSVSMMPHLSIEKTIYFKFDRGAVYGKLY